MSNIDKQALRGLSVEAPFYLAECCNCGEVMPSSKLRESRNYPDDDGEAYCPRCNADDCDIADLGAAGSEGVTAWNYQQKRIEALLDELEAAEKRIAELEAREVREEGNQFLVVRHPGKSPVIKHSVGDLEVFLRQLLEHDPMATIDIVTHRYYGVGGQWVQDADEYLHMMAAAGINGEG